MEFYHEFVWLCLSDSARSQRSMRQLFELLLLLPLDGVLFLGYVSQRRTAFFFQERGRGYNSGYS